VINIGGTEEDKKNMVAEGKYSFYWTLLSVIGQEYIHCNKVEIFLDVMSSVGVKHGRLPRESQGTCKH